jgi:phosphoglycolate phosphatase-like HAD superfamily hydrolase
LEERYVRLSAAIETDRDVPLLVRALMQNQRNDQILDDQILQDWDTIAPALMQADGITDTEIVQTLAHVRDQWIETDRDDWMSYQPFYLGVTERLQQILSSSVDLFIITNRIQRFAQELLHLQGLNLPEAQIFGKEADRQKYMVLQQLIQQSSNIWFVEDHLRALQLTRQQDDLASVKLFLADWGFNTQRVQALVQADLHISLLSMTQFMDDFPTWLEDAAIAR